MCYHATVLRSLLLLLVVPLFDRTTRSYYVPKWLAQRLSGRCAAILPVSSFLA
jgi:hypothetical protein